MKAPIFCLRSWPSSIHAMPKNCSFIHSIANALLHGFVLGDIEYLTNRMDNYNSRTGTDTANSETSGWKSVMLHAMVVWEITYAIIVSSPRDAIYNTCAIKSWVQRFEKEVYASARNKDDYDSNMARWIVSIDTSSQISGRRPLAPFSNPSETASSSSSGGNERDAIIFWRQTLYNKVQKLTSKFFSKFPNWCRLAILLLEKSNYTPQHLKIAHVVKCNLVIRLLENIVLRLHVTKGQISPNSKEKLDRLEKLLIFILSSRNVSSHHQGSSSAHEPSVQRAVPSQSRASQENLSEFPSTSQHPRPNMVIRKRRSTDSEEEKPEKLMKQEATECNQHEEDGGGA